MQDKFREDPDDLLAETSVNPQLSPRRRPEKPRRCPPERSPDRESERS